mgnify:CR=1 FL=1
MILFLGFLLILGSIFIVWTIYSINSINSRIKALQKYLNIRPVVSNASQVANKEAVSPINESSVVQTPIQNQSSKNNVIPDTAPNVFERFIEWLKEDWILKIGALLLLLGFGWFVSYAFLQNWVGPVGRIAFGLIIGSGLLSFGWVRIQKFKNQGSIFLFLGASIILVTVYSARFLYDMFTPTIALALIFATVFYVSYIGAKFHLNWLNIMALIYAGIAPFLISGNNSDISGLYFYLFVVIVGVMWVTLVTGSSLLLNIGLVFVFLYNFIAYDSYTRPENLVFFNYLYVTMFFVFSAFSIARGANEKITMKLLNVLGVGLFLLWHTLVFVPKDWQTISLSSWVVVFTIGAYLLLRIKSSKIPYLLYSSVSIVLLTTAVYLQFSEYNRTLLYTVIALVVPILYYYSTKELKVGIRSLLVTLLPVGYYHLVYSTFSYWVYSSSEDELVNLFNIGVLSVMFLVLGLFFRGIISRTPDKPYKSISTLVINVGAFYYYLFIWNGTKLLNLTSYVVSPALISLTLYTLFGLVAYFYGVAKGHNAARIHGAILIAFITLRLLFIDAWLMDFPVRISTFVLIGVMLISTAFIANIFKKEQN